ncbi:hypothetical protein ACQPZX_35875 [Actinoplanes sp. CA-142083]|uniref:hypothetical protein n=1 Tax=Actinoplanes sp. CA-142083 TaxID=3239903 RepID=UPI003D93D603
MPPGTVTDWAAATRRLISGAVAYGIVAVVGAVVSTALLAIPDGEPAKSFWAVLGGLLGWVALGTLAVVVLLSIAWLRATGRMSRAYGAPANGHLGIWAVVTFLVLLVVSFVLGIMVIVSAELAVWAQAVVRVVAVVLLVAGLRHTRAWFRGRVNPGGAVGADLVSGGDPFAPKGPTPTSDDWDASSWDPDIQRDIDRRRGKLHD